MRKSLCRYFATDTFGLFVNGKEIFPNGCQLFDIENPAIAKPVYKAVQANINDVDDAINKAHETFKSGKWSNLDVRLRSKILYRIADSMRANIPRLIDLEVAQTGRAVKEMKAQLARLPEWFEYYGSLIRTHEGSCPPFLGNYLNYVKRVPLGVCGLLTPWNHPMLIAVKKIAPAIACGNSVVVKPSELAPASVIELAKLCTESDLPDGVLQVLTGTGSLTGQAICSHPHIRKVDLTGGTSTGRLVGAAAGRNLSSVVSELGGKAPLLIFDDADIDQAVNGAAFASFIASGQTCIMGARLIIHQSIFTKFMTLLVTKAKSIRLGDPTDMTTQMGPVISEQSRDRIQTMISDAKLQGAELLTGGYVPVLPPPFDRGYYIPPTILAVNSSMTIWKDEVFGPVVVAQSFRTEEEAIELANDSPYGLAAAVWTRDVARAHRICDKLDVGIVWINDHHRNDPSSPWGGMKESGIGRENGMSAFLEYTQTRSVIVKTDNQPFDWFQETTTRYS